MWWKDKSEKFSSQTMEQTELSENVKPKKQAVDHHLPHFFRGSVGV